MKKRLSILLVLTLMIGLLGSTVLAETTDSSIDNTCCQVFEMATADGTHLAKAVINMDGENLRVEIYTDNWQNLLFSKITLASASSVAELPTKADAYTKTFSSGETLAYHEVLVPYDKTKSKVFFAIEAELRDLNGGTFNVWAKGTPLVGSEWKEYITYNVCNVCNPPEEPTNSPRTIGYWKTHAGFLGNNEDMVSQYLPITLGANNITDAETAVEVFQFKSYDGGAKNGYNKLAAQLLAAKLNGKNGASTTSIKDTITQADALLSLAGSKPWSTLSSIEQQNILNVMNLLDQFNNSGEE